MRHIEVGFCLGAVSRLRFSEHVIGGSGSAPERHMNTKMVRSTLLRHFGPRACIDSVVHHFRQTRDFHF